MLLMVSRNRISGSKSNKYRILIFSVVLAGLMFSSMFLFSSSTLANDMDPNPDQFAPNEVALDIDFEIDDDVGDFGLPFHIPIVVTDNGYPVIGARVVVTTIPQDGINLTVLDDITDQDGRIRIILVAEVETETTIVIQARVFADGPRHGFDTDSVIVHPPTSATIPAEVWYIGAGALIVVGLGAGATEVGKYALMKAMIIPLYSRVKKEEVLDHFVRGQIYGYIMSHPGQHYNAIKNELKVTNGTLSHHLKTLEIQGFIKSHRDGTYKRFYPMGAKLSKRKGIRLSDLQLGILDNLRQSPGMTQSQVAAAMGMSQQSISYNLNLLVRNDITRYERSGVRKHYYINDETNEPELEPT